MASYRHLFWWDPDTVSPDNPTGRQIWCSTAPDLGDGHGWCEHLHRACHTGPEPEHHE